MPNPSVVLAWFCTVANNQATGEATVIAAGNGGKALSNYATIAGGFRSKVLGRFGTILGEPAVRKWMYFGFL